MSLRVRQAGAYGFAGDRDTSWTSVDEEGGAVYRVQEPMDFIGIQ